MAAPLLPNAIVKRHFLYGPKATPEEQTILGERFLAAGRTCDAIEFFLRARNSQKVKEVRDRAAAEGDAYLLGRVATAGADLVPPDVWRKAADAAEKAGRLRQAARAFENAGDADRAAAVLARVAESSGGARRLADLLVARLKDEFPQIGAFDHAGIAALDRFFASRRAIMHPPSSEIVPTLGAYVGEFLVGQGVAKWLLAEPPVKSRLQFVKGDPTPVNPFALAEECVAGPATLQAIVSRYVEWKEPPKAPPPAAPAPTRPAKG